MTTSLRPLAFAVAHINASTRDPIDEAALLAALTSDAVPPKHEHHVLDFLDETTVEALSDLVRGGVLTYTGLARLGRRYLPPDHETRIWLDERA